MLVRLLAFFLFVVTIQQTFTSRPISAVAVFAFTLLWGSEVFKNDRELYREPVLKNWTGMRARWELEGEASVNPQQNKCGFLTKVVKVLTKSVYDYSHENITSVQEKAAGSTPPRCCTLFRS